MLRKICRHLDHMFVPMRLGSTILSVVVLSSCDVGGRNRFRPLTRLPKLPNMSASRSVPHGSLPLMH